MGALVVGSCCSVIEKCPLLVFSQRYFACCCTTAAAAISSSLASPTVTVAWTMLHLKHRLATIRICGAILTQSHSEAKVHIILPGPAPLYPCQPSQPRAQLPAAKQINAHATPTAGYELPCIIILLDDVPKDSIRRVATCSALLTCPSSELHAYRCCL